jgi:O-antigen/teichoic acid export membrane protein
MYLDAMDHPQKSFSVTAVGVVANVVLNSMLIPFIGINGAAIATLVTMTLNGLLARRALSRFIKIRLESHSLFNIMVASFIMGILVVVYRLVIPLSNVWVTLLIVAAGGVIYAVSVLKLDRKICSELRGIVEGMGMGAIWPAWL